MDAHALTVAVKRPEKLEDDTQKPKYIKTVYELYQGEWMIEIIILIVGIFVLSGIFYSIFIRKKKL